MEIDYVHVIGLFVLVPASLFIGVCFLWFGFGLIISFWKIYVQGKSV
jgi:hypothetical protein